jgi:hypothetical protein
MPITYTPSSSPFDALKVKIPDFTTTFDALPSMKYVASLPRLPWESDVMQGMGPGYTDTGGGVTDTQLAGISSPWITKVPTLPKPPAPPAPAAPTNRSLSWELNFLDPLGSIDDLTGQALGLQQPIVGAGGTVADPFAWFNERGITLANGPTRMLDYAVSTPGMILTTLLGQNNGKMPIAKPDGTTVYAFEQDPNFYAFMRTNPSDAALKAVADQEAAKYSQFPDGLAAALFARLKTDRDQQVNATTSGNEQTDYLAKKMLEWVLDIGKNDPQGKQYTSFEDALPGLAAGFNQVMSFAGGAVSSGLAGAISFLPIVGTPLASFLDPVSQQAEEDWLKLSPDQRMALIGSGQMLGMGEGMVAALPFFSGLGAVVNLVKLGGEGAQLGDSGLSLLNMARDAVWSVGKAAPWAYPAYTRVLQATNLAMATGVTMLAANWALETYSPSYAQSVGRQIDMSRPFSDSQVAGVLDYIGYFSSATFGAATAIKLPVSAGRSLLGRAFGRSALGEAESLPYANFLGGAAHTDLTARANIDAANNMAIDNHTTAQRVIKSGITNWLKSAGIERAQTILGEKLATLEEGAARDSAIAATNDYLANVGLTLESQTERLLTFMSEAHRPLGTIESLFQTDAERLARQAAKDATRDIEDAVDKYLAGTYDMAYWGRELGVTAKDLTPAGFRSYLIDQAPKLGVKLDVSVYDKAFGQDVQKWMTQANVMHALAYDRNNAELVAAIAARPDLGLAAHADDYLLMRANHLFANEADLVKSAIDSLGSPDPLMSTDELGVLIRQLIRKSPELDNGWYARLPSNLREAGLTSPGTLASLSDYLDGIYPTLTAPHPFPMDPTAETYSLPVNQLARRLSGEGQFVVAYKPRDNISGVIPTYRTQAVRVSPNIPLGFTGDGLPQVPAEFGNQLLHVTTAIDKVTSEGLRSRSEIIAGRGDTQMYHGTGNAWFRYDISKDAGGNILGPGLYLTDEHPVARSYAYTRSADTGTPFVKEYVLPPRDQMTLLDVGLPEDPLPPSKYSDVFDPVPGKPNRIVEMAKDYYGDNYDQNALLVELQDFEAFKRDVMGQEINGVARQPMGFINVFATQSERLKTAVNRTVADHGYDGWAHVGGQMVGGMGEHNVIVLFDPDAVAARVASAHGTGLGAGLEHPGWDVALYTDPKFAQVAADRTRLFVQAARDEVSYDQILQQFPPEALTEWRTRYSSYEGTDGNILLGMEDEALWRYTDARLGTSDPTLRDPTLPERERVAASVVDNLMKDRYPAEPDGFRKLALAQELDDALLKGASNSDVNGPTRVAYPPENHSVGLSSRYEDLAQVDPAQVGLVRVARRDETLTAREPLPSDPLPDETFTQWQERLWSEVREGHGMTPNPSMDSFYVKLADNEVSVADSARPVHLDPLNRHPAYSFEDAGALSYPNQSGYIVELAPETSLARDPGLYSQLRDNPEGGQVRRIWQIDPTTGAETLVLDNFSRATTTPTKVLLGTGYREAKARSTDLWVVDPRAKVPHAGWREPAPEPWRTALNADDAQLVSARTMTRKTLNSWLANTREAPATAAQVAAAEARIRADGFAEPLVLHYYRGNHKVQLDGNGAELQAAINLKLEEVPLTIRGHPTSLRKGGADVPKDVVRYVEDTYPKVKSMPPALKPGDLGLATVKERTTPWAQPWDGLIEDPSMGATPVYRHVERVSVPDPADPKQSILLNAPWTEYPESAGNVYLGNRTYLGRKYDAVFQGWRQWKMTQYQLGTAQRVFQSKYPDLTAGQVETFVNRVYRMSYEEYSPMGRLPKMPLPPQAVVTFRAKEVEKIGNSIFGELVRDGATGAMVHPEYADLLTDAFRQAWTMNLTAGLTSKLKTFGALGDAAILSSDWLVPLLRYKASPIFRASEWVESWQFNAMRGAKLLPAERKALEEAGIIASDSELRQALAADPLTQSLQVGPERPRAPEARQGDLSQLGGSFQAEAELRAVMREPSIAAKLKRLGNDVFNPNPYKEEASFILQAKLLRDDVTQIIKRADPGGYAILHDLLKVPDDAISQFLAEDRVLGERWITGQIGFQEMVDHAAKFNPKISELGDEALNGMYASEDWKALDGLFRIAADTAQKEAFGVHYFGAYRSTLERSINHPVLGIYPFSWAYKAAKEWVHFLYDNRTFGNGTLRLGMTPAVALSQLTTAINVAVAKNTDTKWADWLDSGPGANWFFLINLLLPGDWSSVPFPMSRPIRSLVRDLQAGNLPNPIQYGQEFITGPQNRGGIGVIRDASLTIRGIQDLWNLVTPQHKSASKGGSEFQNLVDGLTAGGASPKPQGFDALTGYPTSPVSFEP